MTQRHRDFGNGDEVVAQDPVTFALMGQTFSAKSQLNGGVLLQFVREADSGSGGRASEAVLSLFEKVLIPESFLRFKSLVDDPDVPMSVEKISEICGWLVEVYSDRPTKVHSISSTSPGQTGPILTAAASAAE